MPISPKNLALYPSCWPEVRRAVLERAGYRCEGCGVRQYAVGYRDPHGRFCELDRSTALAIEEEIRRGADHPAPIQIALATCHLDHDPRSNDGFEVHGVVEEDLDMSNLRAYCQRCHNVHDGAHRRRNRARTRIRQRQIIPLPFPGLHDEIYD